MSHYTTIDGIRYVWIEALYQPETLYGVALIHRSLVPEGMVMTLQNIRGDELTIRGERHGENISFIHLTGKGGNVEIGHWTPFIETPPPADYWAQMRQRIDQRMKELRENRQ